ncbi:MAG TPA: ATP-binding protein [Candidatus Binatia bacterium]|nr:ATP-binding protein [Candidatus Binatia bacterium]
MSERSFDADPARLPELLAFLEDCAQAQRWPPAASLRVGLLAEELFLNSVLHGYAGARGRVRVVLLHQPGAIELTIEDQAPPFDPFAAAAPVSAGSDPRQRPVGRLGLALVQALCPERRYERIGTTNRISVRLPVSPG